MEEQMKNDEIEIDLVEIFHVLMRKIWVIIASVVVGAVLVGCVTKFFVTPQYQATSMIYILGKTTSISSAMDLQLSRQLTVDFEILAKSRPVIENVIDELGLDEKYEEFIEPIVVENPQDSSILKVIVENPDPVLAKDIANALADATAEQVANVMVTDKPSKVEEAVVAEHPVSPNVLKNSVLGGLAGAVLSIAIILVLFLLDDTIKTEEDVKKYLGLNTLAAIPEDLGTSTSPQKKKKKKKKVAA